MSSGWSGNGGEPEKDVAFTIGVIALSAKMAKADGVVSPLEVEAFKRIFQSSPDETRQCRAHLQSGQAGCGWLRGLCRPDRDAAPRTGKKLLQDVLEGLLHVATADGVLHPKEDAFLADVAASFRFLAERVPLLPRSFRQGQLQSLRCAAPDPDATNAEIKAQYRKLVSDNHPDKLMGRGVPAEFIDIATRKLAAINAAYDTIAKERGL